VCGLLDCGAAAALSGAAWARLIFALYDILADLYRPVEAEEEE
jgi:hypothetical protein